MPTWKHDLVVHLQNPLPVLHPHPSVPLLPNIRDLTSWFYRNHVLEFALWFFIAHKYIPAHYSFSCPLRKGCTSSDSRAPPQHFQVFFQPTCWWSSWPRAFLTVCIVLTGAHVKVKLSSALGTSCLFPGGSDLSSVPTPLSPLVWAQQSPTDWQVKKKKVVCLRIGNCRLMKFYL